MKGQQEFDWNGAHQETTAAHIDAPLRVVQGVVPMAAGLALARAAPVASDMRSQVQGVSAIMDPGARLWWAQFARGMQAHCVARANEYAQWPALMAEMAQTAQAWKRLAERFEEGIR